MVRTFIGSFNSIFIIKSRIRIRKAYSIYIYGGKKNEKFIK